MAKRKSNLWSTAERIEAGRVMKEMRDDHISWKIVCGVYHIVQTTAVNLIGEYLESEKK